ncbi:MAG: outer membrane lipid asymmetry maintenance protein MlaD [Gammaproteobacteria bacterium]|nr:MAG: outer membrane lipid asymmetry maintenance protein MlaD [Gammaproteobacteria bacterium]
MESRNVQLSVGLFVVLAILALTMLALKASNLSHYSADATYEVKAYFDNIGTLKLRAPVKVGGVTVGRVSKIELDVKLMRPLVTLAIDRKYRFPTETSAAILTAGLLGEQYISLLPGGNDEQLEPGDFIEDTQSAIILEDLIGQFLFSKDTDQSL